MKLIAASTLIAAALFAGSAAPAADIVRHNSTPPALILQGVTVPAGTEMIYLSGQLANPIDPAKQATAAAPLTMADYGDTRTQTISTLNKIKALLAAKGYRMSDIIKMTAFVAGDPKLGGKMDFTGFNDGFKMFFGTAENPNTVARSTVQVAALAGPAYLIELEVTAAKAPTK